MSQVYQVQANDGTLMDARFEVDGSALVFHSRGGTRGGSGRNHDYGPALELLLHRLESEQIAIEGAWVDSATVQALPLADREVLSKSDALGPAGLLAKRMAMRMKDIRRSPDGPVKGGNPTKRIRIATSHSGSSEGLAALLRGMPTDVDPRTRSRLPVDVLDRVTPEHVWQAVQRIQANASAAAAFGPSTDFDLVTDDGRRLPPKAVFGVALSASLGQDIRPAHFSSGEGSPCFRLLREAGFAVVPKGQAEVQREELEAEDRLEWREGAKRLVSHVARERAGVGMSRAKKAQFRRVHGRLFCERCRLDPVAHYKTDDAESCIEVHHHRVQVSEMAEDHTTSLDDLACLCANCHRLVHRLLLSARLKHAP